MNSQLNVKLRRFFIHILTHFMKNGHTRTYSHFLFILFRWLGTTTTNRRILHARHRIYMKLEYLKNYGNFWPIPCVDRPSIYASVCMYVTFCCLRLGSSVVFKSSSLLCTMTWLSIYCYSLMYCVQCSHLVAPFVSLPSFHCLSTFIFLSEPRLHKYKINKLFKWNSHSRWREKIMS